jgi:hypothetical protein
MLLRRSGLSWRCSRLCSSRWRRRPVRRKRKRSVVSRRSVRRRNVCVASSRRWSARSRRRKIRRRNSSKVTPFRIYRFSASQP